MTVLIAEDEALFALSLSDSLTRRGFDVLDPVSTGEAAIRLAEEASPDALLMDIRLAGDMDGIDAATSILERSNPRLFFMTGYPDKATRERADRLAPLTFLVKPFLPGQLADMLLAADPA